jgi:hypothetical protein
LRAGFMTSSTRRTEERLTLSRKVKPQGRRAKLGRA